MENSCVLNKQIKDVINYKYKYFMGKENVIGVGLGYKIKNNFYTCKQCLKIFVTKKLPLDKLSSKNLIPKFFNGIPTDLVQSDIPRTCSLTNKVRPITGGYSIGVKDFPPGSMGCLVADSSNDYIMTCSHIILGFTRKKSGEVISVLQPPPQYGGKTPRDIVGTLYDYVTVNPQSNLNYIDTAIIKTDRSIVSPNITFLGLVRGISNPRVGEKVQKVGAISGLTTGNITSTDTTIVVNFLGRDVTFQHQIVTTKMSVEGDSGSLLLNKNMQGLGLLIGNSGSNTVFNDINQIMDRFSVHIVRR